jgi:hypothetical protein
MSALDKVVHGLATVANVVDDLLVDPGDVIETTVDQLLPEPIGDLLSIGIDLYTGNYIDLIADGLDLIDVGGQPAIDQPSVEPDPPPVRQPLQSDGAAEPQVAGAGEGEATMMPERLPAGAIDDSFWSMSDQQFLDAVRNGGIPKEVLESKDGMLRLQQRMNDIQQMAALLTNMMRATHELEMEVIRNVRA